MELWIRSQSKLGLYKIDEIYINERDFGNDDIQYYIITKCVVLGKYKTKERALEVLDEIQDLMRSLTDSDLKIIQYEMPKD